MAAPGEGLRAQLGTQGEPQPAAVGQNIHPTDHQRVNSSGVLPPVHRPVEKVESGRHALSHAGPGSRHRLPWEALR